MERSLSFFLAIFQSKICIKMGNLTIEAGCLQIMRQRFIITFSCCKATLLLWCSQCIQMFWISNWFEISPLWERTGFQRPKCMVLLCGFQKGLSKDLQLVSRVCFCFLTVYVSETCNFIYLFSKWALRCSKLVAEVGVICLSCHETIQNWRQWFLSPLSFTPPVIWLPRIVLLVKPACLTSRASIPGICSPTPYFSLNLLQSQLEEIANQGAYPAWDNKEGLCSGEYPLPSAQIQVANLRDGLKRVIQNYDCSKHLFYPR